MSRGGVVLAEGYRSLEQQLASSSPDCLIPTPPPPGQSLCENGARVDLGSVVVCLKSTCHRSESLTGSHSRRICPVAFNGWEVARVRRA